MADVTPDAAMYFGVTIAGLIGAAVGRLRPNGMSGTLFATAFAQALVLAVALSLPITRNPEVTAWTPPGCTKVPIRCRGSAARHSSPYRCNVPCAKLFLTVGREGLAAPYQV